MTKKKILIFYSEHNANILCLQYYVKNEFQFFKWNNIYL